MNIDEFLSHYILNAPQIMWFLGAGSSRSAMMPSAYDIIWDLKRMYYCTKENQNITDNELSNEAIKNKIQKYLNDLGCPAPGSDDEYSYYFKFVLGDDPHMHQKYLQEKLHPNGISINSGHRILSALMDIKKAKLLFTTNFDSVIENAYSSVIGKELHSFSLEGSAAALNALNNEEFPIYAKMHGDFRYYEMKNLPDQLKENDKEIERCFINACSRYGLIVIGYSGRDKNIMSAFDKAIQQENAFPKGLFWFTSFHGNIFPSVQKLIDDARRKGINAHIVEVETFDVFLNRIWKLIPNKPAELDAKIRRAIYEFPNISKYTGNSGFPIIRTNVFPVMKIPEKCLAIETVKPLSYLEFVDKIKIAKSAAILSKQETILAWGSENEIGKVFSASEIKSKKVADLKDYLDVNNTHTRAFLIRALARGIVRDKPLKLRKKHGAYYAVISSLHEKFSDIEPKLKEALKTYDFNTNKQVLPASLAGRVPNLDETYWMEAAEITLDFYDEKFWLVVRPDIWIEPDIRRKDAKDFLTNRKRNRYNATQNLLIDAWKEILLGFDKETTVKAFEDNVDNNPIFVISSTTAFSQRQQA